MTSAPFNVQAKKLLETCKFEVILQAHRLGYEEVSDLAEFFGVVDCAVLARARLLNVLQKPDLQTVTVATIRCNT